MGHLVRLKVQPVLWPRKPSRNLEPLVQRRRREWYELTKHRKSRGPATYLLECSVRRARCVVVQSEDERGDGMNVALSESFEHRLILIRFIEALVRYREVGSVH